MRHKNFVHATVTGEGRIKLASQDPCPVLKLQPALVALMGLALAASGSPDAAAKELGLSLRQFRTRLRQYGLTEVAR